MNTMHEYEKIGAKDVKGFILISSIIISLTTIAISNALKTINIFNNLSIQLIFSSLTASGSYPIVSFLFNKYFWKINPLRKFINIPNIQGTYLGCAYRYYLGSEIYEFTVWKIEQDLDRILIRIESYTSNLLPTDQNFGNIFSEYYQNPYEITSTALSITKTEAQKSNIIFSYKYPTNRGEFNALAVGICNFSNSNLIIQGRYFTNRIQSNGDFGSNGSFYTERIDDSASFSTPSEGQLKLMTKIASLAKRSA